MTSQTLVYLREKYEEISVFCIKVYLSSARRSRKQKGVTERGNLPHFVQVKNSVQYMYWATQ